MDTSLGKILYNVAMLRDPRFGLTTWKSLTPKNRRIWDKVAEEFLREVNTQSTQHFSRLAEIAVRDIESTYKRLAVSNDEFDHALKILFDLLPDPDAKVKDQLTLLLKQEYGAMEEEDLSDIVEEIIKTVRGEYDADQS